MRISKPKTIQTKFLLGLAAIALCGGLLLSLGLYFHLRSLLESEVAGKAEMVLSQVEAVRTYVRRTLRPAMYRTLPADEFMIEAMSTSYVSRKVMENMDLSKQQLHYRRVAINARNPKFEASNRELKLIEYFRENPHAEQLSRFETIAGEQYFLTAKPVRFEASCMNCHGHAEDAPKVLLERYGPERGFGHELNSIAGVTSVDLPVGSALSRIRGATLGYVLLVLIGTLTCFGIVNVLFNQVVVYNLRRVLDVFPRYFKEQAESPILSRLDSLNLDEGDEIDEIMRSVEEMASTLSKARLELENYTKNLRRMVDERTEDLSLEAMERRSDVLLFVSLLDTLKTSQTRRELIEACLPQIGERYGAAKAAFICTLASQNFYSWPVANIRPELPGDWERLLAEARPVFTHDTALIPVQPSDAALEGYLCLYWDAEAETEPGQMRDVLVALGRQMGIAMENLNALDSLLRQNDVLESIFEGIADPLLLMDGACNVILANEAARALALSEEVPASEMDALLARMLKIETSGVVCPLRQVLSEGHPMSYEAELPGGRSFALNIYPLPGSLDRGGRVVVYTRENTTEKRMLENMQQSEKLVTVGKLAAGLAHEINNPLGVILCYAELLRSQAATDQQRADVDVIIGHTKQAQRVLQDLLNFARPRGAGSGPCDPVSVVGSLAEVFSVQAQKRGAVLEAVLPPDLPPVDISAQALEQIMSNLLLNAIDAVSENGDTGGHVRVTGDFDPSTGMVRISTNDDGPGIPAEHMRNIFDPFFTTKEVGKGTGLGLAVAYALVRQAGGAIEARNIGGAVFTLTLPAAKPQAGVEQSGDAA